ncbi:DnaJ C-terminal domain-containing protein [Kitasatospora sp. NPDC048722]|uniref:DnaJ C-terminal domain-containing protein n=1 Tax=Kitasatospora sp. NPDC048722 TaxID=3155639 RepID=UPI0033EAF8A8
MATTGSKDYYAVLGVPRDADQRTIKRVFRELARTYHPDRSTDPDAQERFKEIAEAYAVLSDPDKRSDYDRHGTTDLAGVSVEDLLAGLDLGDLFGGTGMPGFGAGGGLFGGLFGERRKPGPVRGADVEIGLTVPLATVLTGGTGTVAIRRPGPCTACAGSGAAPGTWPHDCDRCHGTGGVVTERRQGNVVMRQVATCTACGGNGIVIEQPCRTCAGRGEIEQSEAVTLKIPRGIAEGAALRLLGKGMPAPAPGGADGDVFVVVRTAADPRFVRRGADLWHGEEITVPDAVLGTTLTVPALDGDVPLTVPPGSQSGTVLRIPGRGLPRRGVTGRGDLHVSVTVRVPDHPGHGEQRLYRQLRELAGSAAQPVDGDPQQREQEARASVGRRVGWWRKWRRPRA